MEDRIVLLLLQIVLILAFSRIVGLLFVRLRQPQVMGEMIAGILLGPSVFGAAWPNGFATIFPAARVVDLEMLSQVGVVFFLFLIGLELDPSLIRSRGRSAVIISLSSIAAPFILGTALAYVLFTHTSLFAATHVPRSSIALFMGSAMSITAFPVLARILTERNLHRSQLGAVAITCAAVNDVAAWCILAVVVAVVRVAGWQHALWTAGLSVAYVLLMFLVVQPFLRRIEIVYDRQGRLSQNVVALIFLLVLVSAFTTAAIGIHALFGAFLMGFLMPKGTQFVRHLAEKLEDYSVVLLLPIFFAYTGLRTQIGQIDSMWLWGVTGMIILVACVGKMGGTAIAARSCGVGWHESAALGILMNTRGLMELIILNIGLQLGVITPTVFTMMVIMAIVTTALTSPLLHLLYPSRMLVSQPAKAHRDAYGILIPVALPKSGGPLVQLADMIIGPDHDAGRLYALHLRAPADHEAYRSGLDEADLPRDESLAPLMAQARNRSLPVESLSFVSRDVASDICSVAATKHCSLVLMGFHKPVVGRTILGGTVHRVLNNCETNVAIFVDRGFRTARRVLVPYLGSRHDRLALDLGGRLARSAGASVTVLHVVPPMRGTARSLNARDEVDKVFKDPTLPTPVTFRVVEDPSPVGVVLHQAQQFDLLIIGVAEEWGLESHLFGWRSERIARDCPCSLLIVRQHAPAAAPTPTATEAASTTAP